MGRSVENEETVLRSLAIADEARTPEEHARAVSDLEDSLVLADGTDARLAADLRIRLARTHLLLGNAERARDTASEAIDSLRRTAAHDRLAAAMSLRGRALDAMGHADEALRAHEDALAIARLTDDDDIIANAEATLGARLRDRSRFREAAARFDAARARSKRNGNDAMHARACLDLAICARVLGDWDRAVERTEQAMLLADGRGDRDTLADGVDELARIAFLRGEDVERTLESIAGRITSGRPRLSTALRGDLALAAGDADGAESCYRTWLADATRKGSASAARTALARVELERGDMNEAMRHLDAAAVDAGAHRNRYGQASLRSVRARVLLRQGDRAAAAAEATEALRGFREIEAPYETARALELLGALLPPAQGAASRREARGILRSLRVPDVSPVAAPAAPDGIPTKDPAFREVLALAARIGDFSGPFLIEGEPGTERLDVARTIHAGAADAGRRTFVTVSGAALSPAKLEGALVEAADGTLVLDDTDHLPLAVQAELLRALETADRVDDDTSGSGALPTILAITSRPLERLVEENRFLAELRFRLGGMVLRVPPLRERPADLETLARRYAEGPLTDAALAALRTHDWPGNVVELRNAVRAARFLAREDPIAPEHLSQLRPTPRRVTPGASFPEQVAALETTLIRDALQRTGGNKMAAAKILGVSRKGLIDRLKRLDLWDEFGGPRRRR